jgi:CRP/FNR family transcriptional regulator
MEHFIEQTDCGACQLNCICLGDLTSREMEEFNENKRVIVFHKGETIYKQRTFLSNIIFIKEGIGKLLVEGSNGKKFTIKLFGPNEYIGLTQLFGKNRSNYTVIALKQTTVCMIEINFFKRLILKRTHLAEKVHRLCSEEYNFLYQRLEILGTRNLHARLSDTLMYLTNEKLSRENVFSHITRKDIAELSAMSNESMIRLLNEFKNDRLVTIDGKAIRIENHELLKILWKAG